jgi:hypothetical protein
MRVIGECIFVGALIAADSHDVLVAAFYIRILPYSLRVCLVAFDAFC